MKQEGIISDSALLQRCTGDVRLDAAGLFSEAVYLRDAENGVLVLHDGRYGALPFGIALKDWPVVDKQAVSSLKDVASLENGVLRIPALHWEIRLRFQAVQKQYQTPTPESKRELEACILETLQAIGKSELYFYAEAWPGLPEKARFSDAFASAGYPGIELLWKVLPAAEESVLREALYRLLGLGRGLTPSFDDFIVGLVYTLRNLDLPQHREQVTRLTNVVLEMAESRTNVFSAAYLKAACGKGRFSLLDDCLYAVDPQTRQAAVEQLSAVGGSSGSDMLAGMLSALKLSRE